jgi:hypothetical protein
LLALVVDLAVIVDEIVVIEAVLFFVVVSLVDVPMSYLCIVIVDVCFVAFL